MFKICWRDQKQDKLKTNLSQVPHHEMNIARDVMNYRSQPRDKNRTFDEFRLL